MALDAAQSPLQVPPIIDQNCPDVSNEGRETCPEIQIKRTSCEMTANHSVMTAVVRVAAAIAVAAAVIDVVVLGALVMITGLVVVAVAAAAAVATVIVVAVVVCVIKE